MKKYLSIIVIIVIIAAILSGCAQEEDIFQEEIVINGDFEEGITNTWKQRNGSGAIFDTVTTNVGSDQYNEDFGQIQLELNSGFNPNWLYLTQEIQVVKDGVYKLEANINVSGTIESESFQVAQVGAYVGFEEDLGIRRINVVNQTDGWQTYIVYFRPVANDTLNIQVGLGTSASLAKGKARFDNISVVRMEEEPTGVEIFNVGVSSSLDRSNTGGNIYLILLSILTLIMCYVAYVLLRRTMAVYPSIKAGEYTFNKGEFKILDFIKSPIFIMTSVLVLAFVVRLIIVNYVFGHNADIARFDNWAFKLADNQPWNFYSAVETTYPPGYLYILWALGSMAKVLGISTGTLGMAIFLKIPAIVADILIVYLLFYLCSKHFNLYISTIIAGLYAILPVVFTNSASWGQMDSVYGLFVLLAFIAMLDKKYISVIVYYTIAVFVRAEMLMLLPIVASFLVYSFVVNPLIRQKLLIATGVAIVSIIVLSLPFTVKLGGADIIFYTFGRFVATALSNPVFSNNAFNFYGIFGLNQESVTVFARVLSFLIYSIIAFYVCFIYFYKRNRAELLLLASFLMAAVYVFSIGMTSQSMIIAFALMLAYIAISGEKRVLLVFTILALTNFVNLAQLLNQSGFIGLGANAQLISYPAKSVFMIIGGAINVITVGYLATVTYDICYSDDVRELEPMNKSYVKTMIDFAKGVKSIFASGNSKKK